MKHISSVTLGIVALLTMVQPSWAQHEPEFPLLIASRFYYAVKVVCGESLETHQEGVTKGRYLTAITIHNSAANVPVPFLKTITRALPYQMAGPVADFESDVIGPHETVTVECNEIRKRLPSIMTAEFRTGFVVILAKQHLNVTAIYTGRPTTGEVTAIDTEVIRPRELCTPLGEKVVLGLTYSQLLVMAPRKLRCPVIEAGAIIVHASPSTPTESMMASLGAQSLALVGLQATDVVLGRIVSQEETQADSGNGILRSQIRNTVDVSETLKGDAAGQVIVSYWGAIDGLANAGSPFLVAGADFVLALTKRDDGEFVLTGPNAVYPPPDMGTIALAGGISVTTSGLSDILADFAIP